MRIKRLEMQGFKSFADKMELEFADGITAVVGPNGSGKSNLADAIKWVLGEQSAKALRGNRMDEVIFSGTKARRGLGLAEVSMIFDNSSRTFPLAFNEVAITRRVFKSGESDYYLNQSQCRLKDVQDLFLDTGVGKDAYSFIGQGRIEELLSARPEDRRTIFEEVAGVAKYKARKRETGNKLADAEASLTRVRDLLHELENQMEPLTAEAAKAREYLALEAERKAQEKELILYELNMTERRQQRDGRQRQQIADQLLAVQNKILQLETEEERCRLEQTERQEQINLVNQGLYLEAQQGERLQGEKRIIIARADERKSKLADLEARRTALESRQAELTKQRDEAGLALQMVVGAIVDREDELQKLQQQMSSITADDAGQRLHAIEQSLEEYAEQRRTAEMAKSLWSDRKGRAEEELRTLGHNHKQAESEIARLRCQLSKSSDQKRTLDADWQALTLEQNRVESERKAVSASLQDSQQRERVAEQQLAAVQSRLRLLQDVIDGLEGYQRGVRTLLQAKRQGHSALRDLIGVVGDLLTAPAELEYAIEIALGGSLQFVVAKTEDAARLGINYLKQTSAGRATFLPLDVVLPRQRRAVELEAAAMSGAVGFAADLVSFDPALRNVIHNLLGNILIVRTLEEAVNIARTTRHQVRMVTPGGDMLLPGGSMSGGSRQQRGSSFLGRQRELSALAEQQEHLVVACRAEKESISQSGQRLQVLSAEETRLTERARLLQLERGGVDAELKSCQLVMENQLKQLQMLGSVREDTAKQLADCQKELELFAEQVATASLALTAEERNMAAIKAENADQLKRRGSMLERSHRLEVELSSLREQAQSGRRQLESLEERLFDDARGLKEITEGQQGLHAGIQAYQLELTVLEQSIRELVDRQDKKTEELEVARQALASQEEAAKSLRQQVRDKRDEQEGLKTGLYSAELRISRFLSECEVMLARLEKDYGIVDRSGLHSTLASRMQGEEVLEQLKAQIVLLGPVRVGSLLELDRLQERVGFLQSQQQDLLMARLSLEQIIQEIDQLMAKRFLDAFSDVRRSFQKMFVELFVGGEADLRLSDQSRPLETGIDILVQPPGKNLQNINLLSGGEKALTAVALLCAVLSVKPTPFCVLDEIDAPLDDVNTRRLMQVIKRLAEQTQFVVITHSKETMLAADTLYGVTMPERGISQLISVRLTEGGNN